MREQAERLRLTLQNDGGSAELAFRRVLTSELTVLLSQFMDVENIYIELNEGGLTVKAIGGNFRKIGFCPEE